MVEGGAAGAGKPPLVVHPHWTVAQDSYKVPPAIYSELPHAVDFGKRVAWLREQIMAEMHALRDQRHPAMLL